MKKILKSVSLLFCSLFLLGSANAQDIHFTQFDMSPLTLNPALTGNFGGMWRVNSIYRNQWSSVTTPFVTFGGSFDAPITRGIGQDDYLAAGIQFYNDRSGDGNLTNSSILASVAYHLALDDDGDTRLSIGMQGSFTQRSIDFARLYWGDEFFNGGFQPGTTGENLNPKTDYFGANVGLAWQHAVSEKFAYTVGTGAFNLTQPQESLLTQRNNEAGLAIRLGGQAAAIWRATDQLSVSPSFLYQTQSAAQEMIAGAEIKYMLDPNGVPSTAPAVYIGGYYRLNDAALAVAGFEYMGFRLGFGYDYNVSDLNAPNGNGGFELALRYIQPNPLDFARRVTPPCPRF